MVGMQRDAAGYGFELVIKPKDREVLRCKFCGVYCNEGYWCMRESKMRCAKWQEKDPMMACRGRDIEHHHVNITNIKILKKGEKNDPGN